MTDLDIRRNRRWRAGGRGPSDFLLDGRLFRLLCAPGQAVALDNFRAALGGLGLAAEGRLPNLEKTPLAILDVIGVEPPRSPVLPYLPESMTTLETADISMVINTAIQKEFEKTPELEPSRLRQRVDELRQATDPAAHELFDLCLTCFVSRDGFEDDILEQLAFDAFFTFHFPDEIPREELTGDELRPRIRAWAPGWLVPCQEDGALQAAMSTGEVSIGAGLSPPAPLPRGGEG